MGYISPHSLRYHSCYRKSVYCEDSIRGYKHAIWAKDLMHFYNIFIQKNFCSIFAIKSINIFFNYGKSIVCF